MSTTEHSTSQTPQSYITSGIKWGLTLTTYALVIQIALKLFRTITASEVILLSGANTALNMMAIIYLKPWINSNISKMFNYAPQHTLFAFTFLSIFVTTIVSIPVLWSKIHPHSHPIALTSLLALGTIGGICGTTALSVYNQKEKDFSIINNIKHALISGIITSITSLVFLAIKRVFLHCTFTYPNFSRAATGGIIGAIITTSLLSTIHYLEYAGSGIKWLNYSKNNIQWLNEKKFPISFYSIGKIFLIFSLTTLITPTISRYMSYYSITYTQAATIAIIGALGGLMIETGALIYLEKSGKQYLLHQNMWECIVNIWENITPKILPQSHKNKRN